MNHGPWCHDWTEPEKLVFINRGSNKRDPYARRPRNMGVTTKFILQPWKCLVSLTPSSALPIYLVIYYIHNYDYCKSYVCSLRSHHSWRQVTITLRERTSTMVKNSAYWKLDLEIIPTHYIICSATGNWSPFFLFIYFLVQHAELKRSSIPDVAPLVSVIITCK